MSQLAGAWRMVVRDAPQGAVLGNGFVVAPGVVLSCARVVRDEPVWLTHAAQPAVPVLTEPPELREGWAASEPWEDLAVVRAPEAFAPFAAPLGPRERPPAGTGVEALGFPAAAGAAGERAVATVVGTDPTGSLLELAAGAGIARGYSGSAAVDRVTGHVVGMLTWSQGPPPAAWLVPLDVIAARVAGLDAAFAPAHEADHRYVAARRALARREYDEAAHRFLVLARTYGDASLYFFAALGVLHGRPPREHSEQVIAHVETLLRTALERDEDCVPAVALWALVKEDHFRLRGLPVGAPSIELLSSRIDRIEPRAAGEILAHVDAPGTGTSRLLRHRSSGGGT